jgi:hypothetical protein
VELPFIKLLRSAFLIARCIIMNSVDALSFFRALVHRTWSIQFMKPPVFCVRYKTSGVNVPPGKGLPLLLLPIFSADCPKDFANPMVGKVIWGLKLEFLLLIFARFAKMPPPPLRYLPCTGSRGSCYATAANVLYDLFASCSLIEL